MSKVVKAIVGVALVVVGVVTGNFQLVLKGASLFVQALIKPKSRPRAASATTLQVGEVPRQALFGRAATAGSLVDCFNYGGKYGTDWEVLVIALADHKCDALEGFYVNDTYVAYGADGMVAGYNNQLAVYWRSGTETQTVPSILTTNGPGWTANDNGAGVCYAVVAYKADEADAKNPIWPGGRPKFLFVLRGALVYDSRKDSSVGGSGAHRRDNPATWQWSENPIVCRYSYARGVYACDRVDQPAQLLVGRGLTALEAPPQNVFARANVCDEVVDGEPRYRVSGVVDSTETFMDVEGDFAAACAGTIIQPQGCVEIDPGQARAAVMTITDRDLLVGGKVKRSWFRSVSDKEWVNTVVATYVDPQQKWTSHAAPVRRDNADIAADKSPRELLLQLGFVSYVKQAGRIAEIMRRFGRLPITATIPLPPRFSQIEEGDWIIWQSDRYLKGGAYTFRVEAWGSDQGWRHTLTLRQISASVFADTGPLTDGSVAVQQAAPPAMGQPGAVAWTATYQQNNSQGDFAPAIVVTGAIDDVYANQVRFEYWRSDGVTAPTAVTNWTSAGIGERDTVKREITGIGANATYYVAVSYLLGGQRGDRRILGPINVGAFPTAQSVRDELLLVGADGNLSTVEKQTVKIRYDDENQARQDMDTAAGNLSITAERTALSNAWSALNTYLGTIAPGWNNTSTASNIVRATWEAKWGDYFDKKAALRKKIDEEVAKRAVVGGGTTDTNGNPWNATNGATADLRLTSVGPNTATIVGNMASKAAGAGFNCAIRSERMQGAMFASATITQLSAGNHTMVGFDASGTGYDRSTSAFYVQYNVASGAWEVWFNGGGSPAATGSLSAGLTGEVVAHYDNGGFQAYIAGQKVAQRFMTLSGRALFPTFYIYDGVSSIKGMRAGPAADNVSASGDIKLTNIGSTSALIFGNTISASSSGTYAEMVRGEAIQGPCYAEVDIIADSVFTMVCLDDSPTDTVNTNQTIWAYYNYGSGYLYCRRSDGVEIYSGTIGQFTGKLRVANDGANLRVAVAGKEWGSLPAIGLNLTLYPKWYCYNVGYSYTGLRAGPFSDNLGAAGQLTKLTVINSGWASVAGNSVSNITASDSYNSTVNGDRQQGPCYVECEINPTGYTMLGFDEVEGDSSAYSLEWQCHIYNGGAGLTLYKDNATSSPISSGAYSGSGGKMARLVYDGSYVWLEINGAIVLDTKVPAPPNKKYYPKITPYSAGAIIRRISYGPYNDSRFDSIGPIGKPEPYATSADNMIPNGSLSLKLEPFSVLTNSGSAAYWAAGTIGDPSSGYVVFPPGGQNYLRANYAEAKPLLGAKKLYLSVDIYRPSGVSGGNISGVIRYFKPNGAASSIKVYDVPTLTPTALGWTNVTAIGTPPSDASHWAFDLYADPVGALLLATNIRLAKTEPAADVTLTAQVDTSIVADKSVNANYAGALNNAGDLPVLFSPSVLKNSANIKLADNVTYAIFKPSDGTSGADGGTATVNNTNGSSSKGDVSVSAFSGSSTKVSFILKISVDGIVKGSYTCTLTKKLGDPPSGGSGGGGNKLAVVQGNQSTTSTSYAAAHSAAAPSLVVASGEKLYVTGILTYSTYSSSTYGTFINQYSSNGTSWTDFASGAIAGSTAATGYYTIGGEWIDGVEGSVNLAQSQTVSAGTWYVRTIFKTQISGRDVNLDGSNITYEAKP